MWTTVWKILSDGRALLDIIRRFARPAFRDFHGEAAEGQQVCGVSIPSEDRDPEAAAAVREAERIVSEQRARRSFNSEVE